jgi:dipeptidyl aminopeptidase/acylaminoacyl peptidase
MTDGGQRVEPYGTWESPYPLELLTKGVVQFGEITARDGIRWWLEGRPEESGRQVLVRRESDGTMIRLTPEGFNTRCRVQEYGGGAYVVDGDLVVVAEFTTGRLHRIASPEVLEALTPEGRAWRFADLSVDRGRNRVLAIREDHEPATLSEHGEAVNSVVAIDLASGEVTVLVDGADFYSSPRLSPDGTQLAWLRWNHPNMPWDGTELVLSDVDAAGMPVNARVVAGSAMDWVTQPRWSEDGRLHFVAEPDGWMNLFRVGDGDRVERVGPPIEAEFAFPDWLFGFSEYAIATDGTIVGVGRGGGRDRLYRFAPDGSASIYDLPFTEISYVAIDGRTAVFRAAAPDRPWAIHELDIDGEGGETTILRWATSVAFDPADASVGQPIEFPTENGLTAFGLVYLPHNRSFRGPEDERPPLIVTSHGGPTAPASTAFAITTQIFTSRGYAVLDVDYGGSTGYGKEYRKRLDGEWGIVDVDDCVNGARWLVEQGLVDGDRLAIRGGSASGYTTLCAITFRETFKAGVSYFGIGDLTSFDTQTHKFESRYSGTLVGRGADAKQRYHDRSPLNFADQISCPALILQGEDDKIVPKEQAEQIVDALWEKHLPHAYLLFPGEDHGFRAAENIIRSIEAELSFYGQIFGCPPADAIEPIEVTFLAERAGASSR